MPRGDGNGPMGRGMNQGMNQGMGRGVGCGMGRGMGPGSGYGCRKQGSRFMSGMNAGWNEKEILEDQQAFLKERLSEVEKQLEGASE